MLVHPCGVANGALQEDPDEFRELVRAAQVEQVAFLLFTATAVSPRYFVGSGKLEEIRQQILAQDANLLLVNCVLTPSQERNLEEKLECRVVDRTGLILDIFAQRARTHEGKLQVELAQLNHISTRLVRGWGHLKRQKGGLGLRGPGETQLETDRRLLRARIQMLEKRLDKVRSQRALTRRARQRAQTPLVSLVGYTNAGKSTLFNALSQAGVYAADQLFATLDPTLRRLVIDGLGPFILADTVGFIRHLPHNLVRAFHATLEESIRADLLLHVVDCACEDRMEMMKQVRTVLAEVDEEIRGQAPTGERHQLQLEVFNKADLLGISPRIERDDQQRPCRVWMSAQENQGLDLLQQAIAELLTTDLVHEQVFLLPHQGRLRSRLYRLGAVQEESFDEQGVSVLNVRMPRQDFIRMFAQEEQGEQGEQGEQEEQGEQGEQGEQQSGHKHQARR